MSEAKEDEFSCRPILIFASKGTAQRRDVPFSAYSFVARQKSKAACGNAIPRFIRIYVNYLEGSQPSGPGPTAGFISLSSHKETNQRNGSPAVGFFVRLFCFCCYFRLVRNRLESITVRRCGGFGWSVFEVAG
jgi:hypothetical protein